MKQEINLAELITGPAYRDAIHVAVTEAKAGVMLLPGEHVGFKDDNVTVYSEAGGATQLVGVVSPYLKEPIQPGQRFWLMMYPNTITSLRHEWTHPAFEIKQNVANDFWSGDTPQPVAQENEYLKKAAAEAYLRDFAKRLSKDDGEYEDSISTVTFQDLLFYTDSAYKGMLAGKENWDTDWLTLPYSTPDFVRAEREQFWENYGIYRGVDVPNKDAYLPVSCSC